MPEFIRKLVSGYLDFRDHTFKENEAHFRALASKQRPKIMIIACCDSRVDPAIITHAEPGDVFILRNVANLVPPCEHEPAAEATRHGTSAALEFAVTGLEVKHIIVLGHGGCGGIKALLTADPSIDEHHDFIHSWMRIAEPARERTLREMADAPEEARQRFCEQAGIQASLANLMTFPWVAERVAAGTLMLHGWYFDIGEGRMYRYDAENNRFEELTIENAVPELTPPISH